VTGVTGVTPDPGELVSGRAVRSRPRHRLLQGQAPPRHAGGLGRAPAVAMVVHILAAFALMPVAGHPYDLAALSGTSGAWLRWGIPLFYHWKFGFDLSILAVGSQSLSFVLEHLGMSGAAALAVAWKLPLVLADLLVGAILVDLGRKLRCQRPTLMATLWLISPVPLWVSAGHGQIESLTILAVVLSLDLLLRGRPLLAGVVAGLGIGVEYLPALVAIVVIFWLHVSAIERREAYRFSAGCAVALAFCFGPLLSTSIGRTSLLAGLSFSAAAASHPGHAQAASRIGSSLWAVFDLSPGPFWLAAALSMSLALMIVLAHKARNANSTIDRRRLGILAAGSLLLCVSLFDPGALPQFSVLVIGGLCIVGLCVDLSPAVVVLGPLLQLAAGLMFVYGGSFQSYWYDMWATTGASGWPFPQSLLAADLAARLGVLVVALGLLASSHVLGAKVPAGLRTLVARSSIAAGVIGSVFLAIWSLQPAFWQGVGSQGPSTLADFPLITAFQPGTVSMGPDHQMITFSPQEVLAARESTVPPSLKLTVTARPFFAQTTADAARSGHGAVQALTIPGWPRKKAQVHSLWVSALLGRPAWRSQADVLGRVPALAVEGHRLDLSALRRLHRGGHQLRSRRNSRPPAARRLIISSGEATWVAPGWAVVTYAVPASMVSSHGRLTLGLLGNHHGADVIAWNGSPHVRWVLVSLRSGKATVTIDGTRWRDLVTLPRPRPSLWYQHVEETSIQGVPLTPDAGVSITQVVIGGTRGAIVDGGLAWPSPGVLDHTIDGPLLSALGIVDVITLLGGALVLRRWAAGTRMPHVRFRGNPQKRVSREADTESRAYLTQYSPPAEAAE
jgi:Glycosyltransferase family 87